MLIFFMLAGGCASSQSILSVPKDWSAPSKLVGEPVPTKPIEVALNDPVLLTLLSRVPETPQLEEAQARLSEALSLARAARSGLLPSLNLSASGTDTAVEGDTFSEANAQLNLSFPLDLAGRGRNRFGAAMTRAQAQALLVSALRQSQSSLIAQALTDLRAAETEISLRERQQRELLALESLVQDRRQAGLETGRPRQSLKLRLAEINARLAGLSQSANLAQRALERLTAATPSGLDSLLRSDQTGMVAPTLPSFEKLPAKAINDRPDVALESRLLASTLADARAARADRWPEISFSAVLRQIESNAPIGAASSGPGGASFGLGKSLLAPLFDFGRLQALEGAARARAEAQSARYRLAVMNGLNDVGRERTRLNQAQTALDARLGATVAAQRDQDLATFRATAGLSAGTPILESRIIWLDAQIAANTAKAETTRATFALLYALGGNLDTAR
jgi:outer membrane protein TolC